MRINHVYTSWSAITKRNHICMPWRSFQTGGHLNQEELIQGSIHKAFATMNMSSSIGVNPFDFPKLICISSYAHAIRPQLD